MAAGGAPARASGGPCSGDPFVEDYRISVDDCDAYHNFHLLKRDMACLEDIKVPCLLITFTEMDPREAPLLFTVVVGAVVFFVTPGNQTAVGAGVFLVTPGNRIAVGAGVFSCYTRQPNLTGLLLST